MKEAYPELALTRETIARVIRQEEEAFADTLGQGLRDFDDRARKIKAAGSRTIPGIEAFFLYDTRGLPLEIIEDLAQENDLVVDEAGFNQALEEQRTRSRQDYEAGKSYDQVAEPVDQGRSTFVGYGYSAPVKAKVRSIYIGGQRAELIASGQSGEIVLDSTPFYAEAGGQVGDTGLLLRNGSRAQVIDTQYRGTAIAHIVEMQSGVLQEGQELEAAVDLEKRLLTMKNHTATHLLHAALQKILGPHVKQAGSLVAPDRLRFDFTHYAPLTPAEIRKVEDEVNQQIWRNIQVETQVMDLESAMTSGAVALFGEKYQEQVRVVRGPGVQQGALRRNPCPRHRNYRRFQDSLRKQCGFRRTPARGPDRSRGARTVPLRRGVARYRSGPVQGAPQ